MKKTTVYLDDELAISLKDIAKREDRSEAEIIREGLSIYVDGRRRLLPSFVGSVSDDSFSAVDDENYLEEHWKPDW